MDVVSCFHISIVGQIEYADFPLGSDGSQVFCRYEIVAGPDWELISGLKTGITQCSITGHLEKIVFNMPIEAAFKATNPYGWPQIVLSVYGKNFYGTETALGYARAHVPIIGSTTQQIIAPILIPRCNDILAELSSWITGKNPELKDPKILTEGTKNKGLQTECYGNMVLNLQTISRGTNRMGYDWGQGGE